MNSPDARIQFIILMLLAVAVGIIGILVVFFLLVAWRRSLQRNSGDGKPAKASDVDVWRESGQRVRVEERAEGKGEDDDEGDEEDEDADEDEDEDEDEAGDRPVG